MSTLPHTATPTLYGAFANTKNLISKTLTNKVKYCKILAYSKDSEIM